MPGFNIEGSKDGPNAVTELRRKHRWTMVIANDVNQSNQATLYLQKAARPSVKFEEAVMHHDQERAYFAGRTEWEPLTIAFYDAEQSPDVSKFVYDWVQKVVNIPAATVAPPSEYKNKRATINMHDGAGTIKEAWTLLNVWPQATNWQDLDYSNTEIQTVEIILRYDRATRESKT